MADKPWAYVNPSSAETRIFPANLVNTMSADALALCVTMSSTTMLLNKHGSLPSMRKDLNYMCHLSVPKWLKTQNYFYVFTQIFSTKRVKPCYHPPYPPSPISFSPLPSVPPPAVLPCWASITAGSTWARSCFTLVCFTLMFLVCTSRASWISWDVTFLRSASCWSFTCNNKDKLTTGGGH